MLTQLKYVLKLIGIVDFEPNERRWPLLWRIGVNFILLTSMSLFSMASIVYCVKYLNMIDTIKTAGYSYNNAIVGIFVYLHLLVNRKDFERMVLFSEELVQQSNQ